MTYEEVDIMRTTSAKTLGVTHGPDQSILGLLWNDQLQVSITHHVTSYMLRIT